MSIALDIRPDLLQGVPDRALWRSVIIVFPLMPYCQNSDSLLISDLEQRHVA